MKGRLHLAVSLPTGPNEQGIMEIEFDVNDTGIGFDQISIEELFYLSRRQIHLPYVSSGGLD